ncbi:rod shape-determining protein MreC [Muriicola sp. E247]|uniref:rod shape-determining protein MreC n=1 Tax=Muriicola sp. E247 TaxID=3242730 RepID=UPI0035250597
MQQIINFILRNKTTLLYLFLLTLGISMSVQSHSYHRARFFNSANWLSGSLYGVQSDISSYFNLREENEKLVEENTRLRNLLFNLEIDSLEGVVKDSFPFEVIPAKIIKNSYALRNNYITINKGAVNGIEQDMGVITSKGILGIVEHTSNGFAAVQSLLNTKSNINAKIKNTNNFGSLKWNTDRFDVVQLEDIPRIVELYIGDTIVTGAMSSIFPENIPIGTIKKFDLLASENFYTIDVALFNDMTNIKNVYIIKNRDSDEIQILEEKIENDQ